MEKLALHGGPKAKPTPYNTPNRYGDEERNLLNKAIDSGRLMGTDGMVADFETEVARAFHVKHVIMVTSGTAALHTALCALGVCEGDEVITNPMTDMGTIGDAGGFSMNESKQMSSGDGGFITTNDDETARIARLFRDKTYVRDRKVTRGEQPVSFFATNYRPTALQAAVGIAQLHKLEALVARRAAIVKQYYHDLSGLSDLEFPHITSGSQPSYWPLAARYTGDTPTRDELAKALRAEGLRIDTGMAAVNNILRTELIQNKRYYPLTDTVPAFWRDTLYDPDSCPNVDALVQTCLRLPVDERYTDEDIDQTISAVKKVWAHYFD
jgi:dTDP-4-amino-4,6-dideoxygalactose transaminase